MAYCICAWRYNGFAMDFSSHAMLYEYSSKRYTFYSKHLLINSKPSANRSKELYKFSEGFDNRSKYLYRRSKDSDRLSKNLYSYSEHLCNRSKAFYRHSEYLFLIKMKKTALKPDFSPHNGKNNKIPKVN